MSVEPHQVTSVSTPLVCMDKPKTREQYLATLHARYGHPPPGMAMSEWLAKMENLSPTHEGSVTTPEARIKLAAFRREQGHDTLERVLAALTKPMTLVDLTRASGISKSTVSSALQRALRAGRVKKEAIAAICVWERVE